jgi:hypothetical protein
MSNRQFDQFGYPCEPHDVDEHVWYYVQKEGIMLVHRVLNQPSETVVIPWRMIKRALADHEKAKERKP